MVTFSEIPEEITLCVNLTNCPCHCHGCHSPHLWEDIGEELTPSSIHKLLLDNPGCTCICFMGGDSDQKELMSIISQYKYMKDSVKVKFAIYSGRTNIPENWEELNYLKIGPYMKDRGPINQRGTNQRLFMISKVYSRYSLIDITSTLWK